jgi:aminopeptidase YwaD
MNRFRMIFIFLLFSTSTAFTQKLSKSDKGVITNLKAHIFYLADDKLEGRRAGSEGEKLASDYISTQFKSIGILPKGTNGYLQAFEINDGKQITGNTSFTINGKSLVAGKDFFPLPFSAMKTLEASPAIAIQEPDMPWFIDLKEALTENKSNPHFDLLEYIRNNSTKAFDKGATAIILYNTSTIEENLVFNPKDKKTA